VTTTPQSVVFLSVEDLAARYGVPKPSIYGWLHRGTAPRSHKFGRHRRFRLDDVLAWEADRADDRTADAVA
jgi:excisionase family DNA binding protein